MSRSILGEAQRELLLQLAGDQVLFDEPMARHTTLRIGGPADAWVTPTSIEMVQELLAVCGERRLPVTAVGGGCNLLVRDGGVRGVVIATRKLGEIERINEIEIEVGAGVVTGKLISAARKWGLGGLEFLAGIPGSVGGALIMNAGTPRGEMKDVTAAVASARLGDGELIERDAAECGFVYRGSAFPADEVILAARVELTPRDAEAIDADITAIRDERKGKEPRGVAVSGSTFKNPMGNFAGRLIEQAGLKGTKVGDSMCSPVHANWLVNTDNATAADHLGLIELVREKVAAQFGVELELELRILGED